MVRLAPNVVIPMSRRSRSVSVMKTLRSTSCSLKTSESYKSKTSEIKSDRKSWKSKKMNFQLTYVFLHANRNKKRSKISSLHGGYRCSWRGWNRVKIAARAKWALSPLVTRARCRCYTQIRDWWKCGTWWGCNTVWSGMFPAIRVNGILWEKVMN